jgi:hypothetical protein
MVVLYGSGAGITEMYGAALPENEWEALRRQACRLLLARQEDRSARILEKLPFELLNGTNHFQDEFCLLRAVVSLERYIRVQEIKKTTPNVFRVIAETVSEIATPLYARFVVVELETDDRPIAVAPPSPQVTSAAVEAALEDAEHLIRSKRIPSALDRVHTALHGYLRVVLEREGIVHDSKAPLTTLFKLLRKEHHALRDIGTRSEELWRTINTTANMVDALNTLRNNASAAHPNEALLEDAEAMLAINSARTLFHYLDAKIEP